MEYLLEKTIHEVTDGSEKDSEDTLEESKKQELIREGVISWGRVDNDRWSGIRRSDKREMIT